MRNIGVVFDNKRMTVKTHISGTYGRHHTLHTSTSWCTVSIKGLRNHAQRGADQIREYRPLANDIITKYCTILVSSYLPSMNFSEAMDILVDEGDC